MLLRDLLIVLTLLSVALISMQPWVWVAWGIVLAATVITLIGSVLRHW